MGQVDEEKTFCVGGFHVIFGAGTNRFTLPFSASVPV
jgi:hypothetical protein